MRNPSKYKYPSPSNFLGVLNKPAIIGWLKNLIEELAEKVYNAVMESIRGDAHALESIEIMSKDDFDKLVSEWKTEKFQKAKDIGTDFHKLIELYITDPKNIDGIESQYPSDVQMTVQSWVLFMRENPQFRYINKSEVIINNDEYNISGMADAPVMENDEEICLDWKTGKCISDNIKRGHVELDKPPLYPEMIWQLSSYILGLGLKRGYVVILAKDKIAYNLVPVTNEMVIESLENIIKPCLQIYNYLKSKEK